LPEAGRGQKLKSNLSKLKINPWVEILTSKGPLSAGEVR
jgi:hypothetical protein